MPIETINFDTKRIILSNGLATWDDFATWDDSQIWDETHLSFDTLRKILSLFNKIKLQGEFNQKIKLVGEFKTIFDMYGDFISNILLECKILYINLQANFDYIIKLKAGGEMAKINQDFEMYQKTDKVLEFTITNKDNTPKDLTGGNAYWVLSDGSFGSNKIVKSTENGIAINGNKVLVTLNDIETEDLSGKFYHELRTIDSDGIDEVAAVGYVTIISSKTKGLGD